LSSITKQLFTPNKFTTGPNETRTEHTNGGPRKPREEMDNVTAKRDKKSNEQYTSAGPPKLTEKVTLAKFHKWQSNLGRFVESLPGYIDGMLTQRPNFDEMSRRQEEYLNDIYINIHVWLAKAGSENSKVTIKTKNIKTYQIPDIVSWWKSVNDIHDL